jgi:hypothetical protein
MAAITDLGALLILLLAALFFSAMGSLLGSLPIVGPRISQWANNMSRRSFRRWKIALEFPIFMLSGAFSKIGRQFGNIKTMVEAAISVPIVQLRQAIRKVVLGYYTTLWNHSSSLAVQLTAEMSRDYNLSISHATALFDTITATVAADYTKLWTHASSLAVALTAENARNFTRNWEHASSLAIALTAEASRNLALGQDLINTRSNSLERKIEEERTASKAQIGELENTIEANKAATAVQIGEVAATIAAVGDALDDLRKNCTDNLCLNLSDLASVLNGIDTMAIIMELFSLVSEAAENPKGAANRILGEAESPIVTAESIINEIIHR